MIKKIALTLFGLLIGLLAIGLQKISWHPVKMFW